VSYGLIRASASSTDRRLIGRRFDVGIDHDLRRELPAIRNSAIRWNGFNAPRQSRGRSSIKSCNRI